MKTKLIYIGLLIIMTSNFSHKNFLNSKNKFNITEIRTINVPSLRVLPNHCGGDCEFDGHGPYVTIKTSIYISESSNYTQIYAHVYFQAIEDRWDWTETKISKDYLLWTAPYGYVITDIISDRTSTAFYHDNNHDWDYPQVENGTLVKTFKVMGDTWGDDACNHVYGEDVSLDIYFNPITIRLSQN